MFKSVRSLFSWSILSGKEEKTEVSSKVTREYEEFPITEMVPLGGHKNIVRVIVNIDGERLASAGDDNVIIVWLIETGKRLCVLEGHTRPVTCLLATAAESSVISGSSDRTVKVWDLKTGMCLFSFNNYHEGAVQCLCFFHHETLRFISGGNDASLWVWRLGFPEGAPIARGRDGDIHCMLTLPGNILLVGSASTDISVYSLETLTLMDRLDSHGDSVRCLEYINENMFASASLNGQISLWDISSMTLTFALSTEHVGALPQAVSELHAQRHHRPWSVHAILAIKPHYLAACIGNGFAVYDVKQGVLITYKSSAHEATCLDIMAIGTPTKPYLCTAAADATIRVWTFDKAHLLTADEAAFFNSDEFASSSSFSSPTSSSPFNHPHAHSQPALAIPFERIGHPRLLCDLVGHSDRVTVLEPLGRTGVASGSSDGSVVLWKSGTIEKEVRNRLACLCLHESGTSNSTFVKETEGLLQGISPSLSARDSQRMGLDEGGVRRNGGLRSGDGGGSEAGQEQAAVPRTSTVSVDSADLFLEAEEGEADLYRSASGSSIAVASQLGIKAGKASGVLKESGETGDDTSLKSGSSGTTAEGLSTWGSTSSVTPNTASVTASISGSHSGGSVSGGSSTGSGGGGSQNPSGQVRGVAPPRTSGLGSALHAANAGAFTGTGGGGGGGGASAPSTGLPPTKVTVVVNGRSGGGGGGGSGGGGGGGGGASLGVDGSYASPLTPTQDLDHMRVAMYGGGGGAEGWQSREEASRPLTGGAAEREDGRRALPGSQEEASVLQRSPSPAE